MNGYLKEINDYLVKEFYEDQFLDMRTFANFINAYFKTSNHSNPPAINAPILPKNYKIINDSINVYQKAFEKLYSNAKKYCDNSEFELITTFLYYDFQLSSFSLKVRMNNGSFLEGCSSYSFNKFQNLIFYITEEPNWKTFKIFYMDYLKRVIDKSFQSKKDSQNLKRFKNDYLNLIEIAFEELTPINKKIKINLKGLREIKAKNKTSIKALIKWKKFLSKIKAETNVKEVKYFYFFENVKIIGDYLIQTYSRNDEVFALIKITNIKTSKSDFISTKEELAKAHSTEMHSLQLQDTYAIILK